jgi:hypothetical protein
MYLSEPSWFRRGSPVPQKTAAARLSGDRERVAHAERETEEDRHLELALRRSIGERRKPLA